MPSRFHMYYRTPGTNRLYTLVQCALTIVAKDSQPAAKVLINILVYWKVFNPAHNSIPSGIDCNSEKKTNLTQQ